MFIIKFRQWLDSNRGPLVSEVTLPTEPKPLPPFIMLSFHGLQGFISLPTLPLCHLSDSLNNTDERLKILKKTFSRFKTFDFEISHRYRHRCRWVVFQSVEFRRSHFNHQNSRLRFFRHAPFRENGLTGGLYFDRTGSIGRIPSQQFWLWNNFQTCYQSYKTFNACKLRL